MNTCRRPSRPAILIATLLASLGLASASRAQSPTSPAQVVSLADAHAIMEGAVAAAIEKNARLGVVVVDASGELIAAEHMDGAPARNIQFAQGKAFASVTYRNSSKALSELYKTRPDRYFGIMNVYGSKVYLVEGGLPIMVDGKLIGAVGIAGTNQDDLFAQAGLTAWEKVRATPRK